ncbi:MAG: hypothetical protein JOZ38_06160 [Candidatus Eremiobacteraeota bacterium]|nr:hypothetical protein [Candidatus Eremiobacteraeota bacterium]
MQTDQVGSVFGRAWQLLSANWVIVVPGLVIGIIAGVLEGFFALSGVASSTVVGMGAAVLGGVIALAIGVLATLLSIAYTTGMAKAAWSTGTTTFGDGMLAFQRDAGSIFLALILLWVLGIIAAFFSVFTFGIVLLLYAIFVIYTIPAVVVDEVSATEAIGRSFDIAKRNFLTTLIVVLLIGIIAWLAGMLANVFHNVTLLGPVVQAVLTQIVVAYATLVIVGEYLNLRAAPVSSGRPPSPPPSSPGL